MKFLWLGYDFQLIHFTLDWMFQRVRRAQTITRTILCCQNQLNDSNGASFSMWFLWLFVKRCCVCTSLKSLRCQDVQISHFWRC